MEKDNKPSALPTDPIMIHLGYIARDIVDLKNNQRDNAIEQKALMKDIKDGSPSRFEFDDLAKEVAKKAEAEHVTHLKDIVENKLVTKEDFAPIKRFVYATIGLVLSVVGVAILAAVIN